MSENKSAALQLDLLGLSGIPTTLQARTVLKDIDMLARFHDQQGRRDAVISLTAAQSKALAKILQVHDRPTRWRGHPLRIVGEI